jgi:hypothetical protein
MGKRIGYYIMRIANPDKGVAAFVLPVPSHLHGKRMVHPILAYRLRKALY